MKIGIGSEQWHYLGSSAILITEIIAGLLLLERYKAVATGEKPRMLTVRVRFQDNVAYCYIKAVVIFSFVDS